MFRDTQLDIPRGIFEVDALTSSPIVLLAGSFEHVYPELTDVLQGFYQRIAAAAVREPRGKSVAAHKQARMDHFATQAVDAGCGAEFAV